MSVFYKIAHKCYTLVWKLFKPQTIGIRAIILKEDTILLVKHSYSNFWYLPGGGLKKNESFEQGLKRELKEELGLTFSNYNLFGAYNNFYEGKSDSILVFEIIDFEMKPKPNKEIELFQFFNFLELPKELSPGTKRRIEELSENKKPYTGLW